MRLTLRCCLVVALAMSISACGGGGGGSSTGSTSSGSVVNQAVGGIWKTQYTNSAGISVSALALVSEAGNFYTEAKNLNNDCADVGLGTISASGSDVTGNATIAIVMFSTSSGIQTDCTFPDGSTSASGTFTGTIVQRSTLTLTETGTTANGTALPSATVTYTYDSLYSETSSLTKIAGTWIG